MLNVYVPFLALYCLEHALRSKKMVKKRLNYVPALFKIFDEILVNAADNLVRCPEQDNQSSVRSSDRKIYT